MKTLVTHRGRVLATEDGKVLGFKYGGGDTSSWDDIEDKPFERVGQTMKVEEGSLEINIYETTNPEGGSTLIIGK